MTAEPLDFGEDPFERTFGQLRGPVHWPSLTDDEARDRRRELDDWVNDFVRRFAVESRFIPPCWAQHGALIEILSALRDHERADYADAASPTAAMDFIRAVHDAQIFLAEQVSKTQCSVAGHRDDLIAPWLTDKPTGLQDD
ncbi:hypothetical protein [Terrabacter carboxydivorans]|uniref:Uncharacterized protein n=1 Tax=Terrabacter carboxydivorans TaxID=619730 RepID=A0ABN3MGR6_9MICO